MITKQTCMRFLITIEPEFEKEYQKHLEYWDNQSRLNHDIAAFSHFVKDKFRNGKYGNATKVFDGVEFLLTDGNADEEVQTAICTSFLENLLNFFTDDNCISVLIASLLGPQSRKYCLAWDKFTGVKTPGLGNKN